MMPWSSTASIRVRLTVWYGIVLALMLVVYASATFLAVRHEFFEQIDDELHDDFETAEGSLAATADGRVSWASARPTDPDDEDRRGTDVWLPTGEQVYRSDAAAALPPVAFTAPSARYHYDSVLADVHPWRTLTGTVMIGGRAVILRVSRAESRVRGQLWEVLVVLVLGFPVVVILAGVGGYSLARRALAPIGQLAAEARRITADRLHERLSVPNEHDEIGRLAAVINETYGRLESSFDQLRRFTADASHELRTPLAVIRGIGESELGEARTAAEHKEAIGSMLEEVDRLTNLVDTLLRLSHGDAGSVRLSRSDVDLGQLTRDVVTSLGILAEERGQRLDVDARDGVSVNADRLVLREAIANLLDNAVKYSPYGSTVSVQVDAADHQARISIADEGAGIPVHDRARIFDRFYRIDEARSREHGGAGLGLAIAKWAVEINGGHIAVEAGSNGGSVFRIVLPLRIAWNASSSGHTTQHGEERT